MHGSQMIYAITLILLQQCDPALTALFTPPRPIVGAYEVCVSAEPIDAVVARGKDAATHYGAIESIEALDAFGTAGRYDRAALARLYGGTHPRVARGWRRDGGRFESITLISPYPDAALKRLNPGTLILRFSIISVSP